MANGDTVATTSELQSYLDVSGDDALLDSLESRVRAWIEEQTGRYFGATRSFTEVLDGPRNDPWGETDQVLFLQEPPGSDTLKIETRAAMDDTYDVLTDETASPTVGTDKVERDGRQLWRTDGNTWPSGKRVIRVSYDYGFDSDGAQPGDVKQAVIGLVGALYRTREASGIESMSLGDASISYADVNRAEQMGFEVQGVIDRYQRSTQVMG